MNSKGFSLVELVIAIGISVFVLSVAAAAFRVASKSIRIMTRLDDENRMLRSAYLQAADDADFWHTEANPGFPYARSYMGGANGGFRPVNLSIDLVATSATGDTVHPNQLMPHDARSWYRNYLFDNMLPRYHTRRDWSSGSGSAPQDGNLNGNELDDISEPPYMRSDADENTNDVVIIAGTPVTGRDRNGNGVFDRGNCNVPVSFNGDPRMGMGWSMRHIQGDYAEISSVEPRRTLMASHSDADAAMRGSRANLMNGLVSELGGLGPSHYMPPGSLTIYQNHNQNQVAANIGNPVMASGIGEVPMVWRPYMPGRFRSDGLEEYNRNSTIQEGPILRSYNQMSCTEDFWSMPFFWYDGTDPMVFAFVYPSKMMANNLAGSAYSSALWTLGFSDPSRYLSSEPSSRSNAVPWSNAVFRDLISTTYIVPRSITDSPNLDLSAIPSGQYAVSYSQLRLRTRGGHHNYEVIRLQDPATGRSIELGFSILGTGYRGARQHWGWKTGYDVPSLNNLGDFYGAIPGP